MYRFAFVLLIFVALPAKTTTAGGYPEILFGNSIMSGNYGHSLVSYSGLSWVENMKGHIPLTDTLFFTPGNSLSLKYTSSTPGNWELSVFYPDGRSFQPDRSGHMISFYVYLMNGADRSALPRLGLLQDDTCTAMVDIHNYLPDTVTHGQWFSVRIPLSHLSGISFDRPVSGIQFVQGQPTGLSVVNHLLIDQIEFLPLDPPVTELAFPALLHKTRAGGQHVDLEWQRPLDPGIRFVKIYRSKDGKDYRPVALQPIAASRYVDFVLEGDRRYYYKVSWVDYQYRESPFSEAVNVEVKAIEDDALLESIQRMHINYFDQHTEINSGMHRRYLVGKDATVDVEATGYSLLAQTVGVSKGIIRPRLYVHRIASMIDFLYDTAEQHHGVFPAYLDGRTGKGLHDSDSLSFVSLTATASLMQGLLVARQHLDSLDIPPSRTDRIERVKRLVDGIDQIWERVEWTAFAMHDTTVLYDNWSPEVGLQYGVPLGGFGKDMLTYILALSSPKYALSADAYRNGLGIRRVSFSKEREDENNVSLEYFPEVDLHVYQESPYRKDSLVYGVSLEMGEIDRSLLEAYGAFLAFEPWGKRDTFANYGDALIHLTQAYKRRDNETNVGGVSLDIWGTSQEPGTHQHLPAIMPAISISSLAFVPDVGLRSIRRLYHDYGAQVFTEFGFRDWINIHEHKVAKVYNPFRQAIVPVMIENHQSGLIWRLFMQHGDIARTTDRFFHAEGGETP